MPRLLMKAARGCLRHHFNGGVGSKRNVLLCIPCPLDTKFHSKLRHLLQLRDNIFKAAVLPCSNQG